MCGCDADDFLCGCGEEEAYREAKTAVGWFHSGGNGDAQAREGYHGLIGLDVIVVLCDGTSRPKHLLVECINECWRWVWWCPKAFLCFLSVVPH